MLEIKLSKDVGVLNAVDAEERYAGAILVNTDGSVVDVNETKWQRMARQGKGFTTVTGFVSVAATETDFMLIRNPANSGRLVLLKEFGMTIGATATQQSIFRFYRAPTVTGIGTPLTVNKVLSTGTTVSVVLAYQAPTISARGTLIQAFGVDFSTLVRDQDLARFIAPGADVLITIDPDIASVDHNIVAVWAEEEL